MAGAITVAGPGTIGDLGAGWSATEDATPTTPNGNVGSTGTVTFTTLSSADTTFKQNNASVFSVTKGDGSSFGLTAGPIVSVDTHGVSATLNQGSALTRFNVDRTVSAVGSGSPVGALDLAMQLSGSAFSTLTTPGGKFWSLAGHDVGFDYQNNPLVASDSSYHKAVTASLLNFIQRVEHVDNSVTVSQYSPNTVSGLYVYGSSPTVAPTTRSMVMYRDISLSYSNFQVTYGPANSATNTGKNISVYIDKVAGTASIKGTYFTGNTLTQINVTASITSLTAVGTSFQILYDLNWVDASTFNLTVYMANTSAPGTYVTMTTGNLTTGLDSYSLRWQLTGICRDLYTLDANQSFTPSSLMAAYTNVGTYDITALTSGYYPDAPIAQFNGTLWNYLNAVCSVTGTEIFSKVVGNTTVPALRPVALVTIAPESFGITPQISVSNQNCALNVSIKNYNTSLVSTKQIYDAKLNNDSISITPGTVTNQTITTASAIDFVFNPTPFADYTTFSFQQQIAIDPTTGNRINYVANPDFENNSTVAWSVYGGGTIAASTVQKYTGIYSMLVTPSGVGNGVAQNSYNGQPYAYAGQTIAADTKLWVPTGTVINATLRYFPTGAGGVPTTLATVVVTGNSAWQDVPIPPTLIPTNADTGYTPCLFFTHASGTLAGFYVDNADMEVTTSPITVAFNGNNISDSSVTYGWQGIANNSFSTYIPTAGNGGYIVSDSAGVAIDPYAWVAYGGSVSVALLDSNNIQLSIVAPIIPTAAAGNYTLSARVGGADIPALSLVGSGIVSTPSTVTWSTGADPKFIQVDNASNVDNVAVGSGARFANAAMAAVQAACGPTLTLTASINMDVFAGFGSIGGTTFIYQNQRWRIVSSSFGNLTVSFTATAYTTVADQEAAWAGKTIAQFESFWAPYLNDDYNIQPLKIT